MSKTVANQRSYSDATSGVWMSLPGVALPTTPTAAYPAGWYELGLLTDKGVIESFSRTATQSWNWQGNSQGRTLYTQPGGSFQIEANEENSHVLRLARPGSTVTTTGGTAEIQTVTVSNTANPFTLSYGGSTTGNITGTAAASVVQTAVQALPGLSTATVTGTGPYSVTFPVSQGNAALLGSSNAVVVEATPGTNPINTTNIKAYTGTDYFQFGIDLVDGNIHKRYIVPNADAVRTGTVTYTASALTVYAFTINCYPDSNGNLAIDINDNPALSGTI